MLYKIIWNATFAAAYVRVIRYILLKTTTNNTYHQICFLGYSGVSDITMASMVGDKCEQFF